MIMNLMIDFELCHHFFNFRKKFDFFDYALFVFIYFFFFKHQFMFLFFDQIQIGLIGKFKSNWDHDSIRSLSELHFPVEDEKKGDKMMWVNEFFSPHGIVWYNDCFFDCIIGFIHRFCFFSF